MFKQEKKLSGGLLIRVILPQNKVHKDHRTWAKNTLKSLKIENFPFSLIQPTEMASLYNSR